jgi:hypothetical protein
MLGSGLLARGAAPSGLGVRAGMTQQEPTFSARHCRRHQLAHECGVPVLREASHSPAMDKITINLGSPGWLPNDHLKDRGMSATADPKIVLSS